MKEKILDAAEMIVQDKGFDAVSFQKLAHEVGLSKPSVFHHFPNKVALAQALVERCHTKYGAAYAKIIESDMSAPDKLRAIADAFYKGLEENRLCLLGSMGHSVPSLEEPVQEQLLNMVDTVVNRYAQVFEQGQREGTLRVEGTPADAAAAFLAMLEGLQVIARAKRDKQMFRAAAESYIKTLLA